MGVPYPLVLAQLFVALALAHTHWIVTEYIYEIGLLGVAE